MRPAEDAALVEGELLAGAELAAARVAGEARQVVDVLAGPAHPIRRRYRTAAPGTLGPESPKQHQINYLINYHVINYRNQCRHTFGLLSDPLYEMIIIHFNRNQYISVFYLFSSIYLTSFLSSWI